MDSTRPQADQAAPEERPQEDQGQLQSEMSSEDPPEDSLQDLSDETPFLRHSNRNDLDDHTLSSEDAPGEDDTGEAHVFHDRVRFTDIPLHWGTPISTQPLQTAQDQDEISRSAEQVIERTEALVVKINKVTQRTNELYNRSQRSRVEHMMERAEALIQRTNKGNQPNNLHDRFLKSRTTPPSEARLSHRNLKANKPEHSITYHCPCNGNKNPPQKGNADPSASRSSPLRHQESHQADHRSEDFPRGPYWHGSASSVFSRRRMS